MRETLSAKGGKADVFDYTELPPDIEKAIDRIKKKGTYLHYAGSIAEQAQKGIVGHPKDPTSDSDHAATLVSPIVEGDLWTDRTTTCTVVLLTGTDKNTRRPIARMLHIFSSHLIQHYVAGDKYSAAFNSITAAIQEFGERCDQTSCSVVASGGWFDDKEPGTVRERIDERLEELILENIGPVEIAWYAAYEPGKSQALFFDSVRRRPFVVTYPEIAP